MLWSRPTSIWIHIIMIRRSQPSYLYTGNHHISKDGLNIEMGPGTRRYCWKNWFRSLSATRLNALCQPQGGVPISLLISTVTEWTFHQPDFSTGRHVYRFPCHSGQIIWCLGDILLFHLQCFVNGLPLLRPSQIITSQKKSQLCGTIYLRIPLTITPITPPKSR